MGLGLCVWARWGPIQHGLKRRTQSVLLLPAGDSYAEGLEVGQQGQHAGYEGLAAGREAESQAAEGTGGESWGVGGKGDEGRGKGRFAWGT